MGLITYLREPDDTREQQRVEHDQRVSECLDNERRKLDALAIAGFVGR